MTAEANLLPCESLHVAAAEAPQPHRDAGQFCSHGRQSITCPHALLACDTVRPGVVFSSIPAASHGQPRGRPAPPSSTGFCAEGAEDPNVAPLRHGAASACVCFTECTHSTLHLAPHLCRPLLHPWRWVSKEVPASRVSLSIPCSSAVCLPQQAEQEPLQVKGCCHSNMRKSYLTKQKPPCDL